MNRGLHLLRHYWAELFATFFGVAGVVDAIANPIGYEGVDKGPDWVGLAHARRSSLRRCSSGGAFPSVHRRPRS